MQHGRASAVGWLRPFPCVGPWPGYSALFSLPPSLNRVRMMRMDHLTGMLSELGTDKGQHRASAPDIPAFPTHVPASHRLEHEALEGQEPSSTGTAAGWWCLPARLLPSRNVRDAANEHRSTKASWWVKKGTRGHGF